MKEDKKLEEIRRKKLRNMMHRKESGSDPVLVKTPTELTDSTFNEITKRSGVVVVDCWAAWCTPCRMIGPIIEELAKNYAGKIIFGKLNVDDNQGVSREFQIMSIPTILVFKNGELVERIVGAMPRKILEPRITRHL